MFNYCWVWNPIEYLKHSIYYQQKKSLDTYSFLLDQIFIYFILHQNHKLLIRLIDFILALRNWVWKFSKQLLENQMFFLYMCKPDNESTCSQSQIAAACTKRCYNREYGGDQVGNDKDIASTVLCRQPTAWYLKILSCKHEIFIII